MERDLDDILKEIDDIEFDDYDTDTEFDEYIDDHYSDEETE